MSEENLRKLIQLQEKDRRLVQLARESRTIPDKQAAMDEKLARKKAEVDAAHAAHMEIQSQIKQLELEVESGKDQIRRYRHQQFEIKNNEAYRALEDEIRAVTRKNRESEDRELELMEALEKSKQAIAQAQARFDEEAKVIAEDQDDLNRRLERVQAALASAQQERDQVAAEVDDSWLDRYERILKNRGDVALVGIDASGICSGCHMKLPPQQIMDTRNWETMTFCSYCGRMLYYAG